MEMQNSVCRFLPRRRWNRQHPQTDERKPLGIRFVRAQHRPRSGDSFSSGVGGLKMPGWSFQKVVTKNYKAILEHCLTRVNALYALLYPGGILPFPSYSLKLNPCLNRVESKILFGYTIRILSPYYPVLSLYYYLVKHIL